MNIANDDNTGSTISKSEQQVLDFIERKSRKIASQPVKNSFKIENPELYELLLKRKKSPEEAIQILIDKGLDFDAANIIVDGLIIEVNSEIISASRLMMLKGFFWFVGGILVTVISYSSARNGGYFIVASGAILYGFFKFVKGLLYR